MLVAVLVTPAFAAATISKTPTSLTIPEAGPEASYTITIGDAPTGGNLVIRLTPAGTNQCGLSTTSGGPYTSPLDITFSSLGQAITVYVLPVDDALVEGSHNCNIVAAKQPGGGANYSTFVVASNAGVGVTINPDNDVAGISVNPLDVPMVLAEGGATDTFRVTLNSQPTADVTVALSTSDSQTSFATPLTFTNANWNIPQTVTVTAIDDGVVEGNRTGVVSLTSFSSDLNYSGKVGNANANITDNDTATIVFIEPVRNENEPVGVVLTTLAQIQYSAGASSLATALTLPIQTTGTSGNPATFNVDYSQTTISVTFPANSAPNSTQPIDFSVIDDLITEPTEQFTFNFGTATASIPNMLAQITETDTLPVNIIDNDTANITINIVGGLQPFPLDEDQSLFGDYTFNLATIPTQPVTVSFQDFGGQCLFTIDGFTYNTGPQTIVLTSNTQVVSVNVVANNDLVLEADPHPCTITHTLTTTAVGYDSLIVPSVTGSIIENDFPPGITFTHSGGSTAVDETGPTSDTFTVQLDSVPTDDVTITITTPDGQTTATTTLTFTPANWNIAQTVTVTAVDDPIFETTPHLGEVILTPSSTDTNYNTLPPVTVPVDITDNDTATVTVTGSPLSVTESVMIGTSYTIAMNALSGVTADTNVSTDADCRISTVSDAGPWVSAITPLTLTGSTARTVYVRAYDDKIVEGTGPTHTCTITHSNTSSGTPAFNNRPVGDVTANVTDNDSASYFFTAATSTIAETAISTSPSLTFSFTTTGEDGGESPSLEAAITIPFTITGGTASGGQDCTPCGTINAQVGTNGSFTTFATLNGLFDDRVVEGDETFNVGLDFETGGTAAQQAVVTLGTFPTHTITVTDNDSLAYRFVFDTDSGPEFISSAIGAIELVFTTVGSGAPDIASAFSVGYSTANNSAVAPGDYTAVPSGSVSFTPGGSLTQLITVAVINDSIDENAENFTVGSLTDNATGSYGAQITPDIVNQTFTYTITDDDTAGGGGGTGGSGGDGSGGNPYIVREQGATSDSFTYAFTSQPTGNVNVTFSVGTETEVSINGGPFVTNGIVTYVLTSGNWNTPVNVVVRAINDTVYEGGTGTYHDGDISVSFDSIADPIYAVLPTQTLFVDVEDNDVQPSIVVSPGTVTVTENGATSSFNVSLSANNPGGPVTVTISNGADTSTVTTVTFPANSGLTPQSVTVTAVDDRLLEGTETSVGFTTSPITLTASGHTSATVDVTVFDNETATVAFQNATLTVGEASGTTSINVVLSITGTGFGAPTTAAVKPGFVVNGVVSASSGAANIPADAVMASPIFTFLGGTNGNTGDVSAVTFTVVDDTISEPTENFALAFTLINNASQAGITTENVSITDNDVPGITFTGVNTGPALLEATGNTNDYTVQLTSTPQFGGSATTATIVITPSADCEVSINGSAFGTSGTITTSALTAFNISVRATNDLFLEGPQTCSVSYAISSLDPVYNAFTRPNDVYNVTDDESGNYGVVGATPFDTSSSGSESSTPATFSIFLTIGGSGTGPRLIETPFDVGYSISGGTATGGGTDYTLATGFVTFDSATTFHPIFTTNAIETFTASIVNDGIDEADETFTIVPAANETGTSGAYDTAVSLSGVPQYQSHTYTILDNDTAGTTTPGLSTLTATEGGSGSSFSYVLTSQPTDPVTVTFTVSDGQSLLNGSTTVTLTFTSLNWTVPQIVNVTAFDDAVVEGTHSSTITYSSTSSDPNYVSGPSTATVTITDNDFAPAITLTGVNDGSTFVEGVLTGDTYTIKLDTVPTGGNTVTIGINAGPDCEFNINGGAFGTGGSITTNGTTPFTIITRALNDFIVEGDHTCAVSYTVGSGDPVYNAFTIPTQNYFVTDNDSATYQFTTSTNSVGEAAGTTFVQVSTTFAGSGDATHPTPSFESFVTVPFTFSGTATGGGTDYSVAGSVTIPQSGTTQTATITINPDLIDEVDETAIFTLGNETTGTPEQQAVVTIGTPSVHTLTILDDDSTPGINVTNVSTGTVFNEANNSITDVFNIQLNSTPTGNVATVITAGPDCEVRISAINPTIAVTGYGSAVTATTNSALTVFTVEARPVNDNLLEADHTCTLTYKVDSTDTAYDDDVTPAIRPAAQTYNILDNEAGDYGMVYLPTPLAFTSSSNGSEATTPANTVSVFFAINTASGPAGTGPFGFDLPFTVGYSVTGGTATGGGVDYTLPAGSVTFDPGTAVFFSNVTSILVPFPVVNDAIDEVNETVIITAGVNETGTTGSYDTAIFRTASAAFQSHPYTINDNDTAGVTVNTGGGVTATEGGTGGSFTVVLTSQPTSDVTITYTITDGQTTTVTSITFTSANWNVPQIVNVTAVNDGIAEGTHTGVISWTSSSSDSFYSGTFTSTVNVTITDNDPGVVTIGGGAVNVVEGGATSSYTLAMNAPTGVTATTTVSGGAECLVSLDGITYTATVSATLSGTTPTPIFVQAINDTVVEGAHTCTLTHTNLVSASSAINGTVISNVTGNVTDNDTAVISYTVGNDVTEGGSATGTATLVITANGVPNTGTLGAGVSVVVTNATGTTSVTDYNVVTNTITFTSGSASGATQTVTYTGSVDLFAEGTETFNLGFGAVTTTISTGVTATGTQSVNVLDINTPTVTNVGGGSVALDETSDTTSDSYTLSMNAQAGVTATTVVTADADTLVSLDNITFSASVTATLTGSAQTTIYVRPYDDRIVEGAHTGTITHGNLVSASPVFSGLSIANVVATIGDDDSATYRFNTLTSSVSEATASTTAQVDLAFSTDGVGLASTATLEAAITVPYSLTGTATSGGTDYSAAGSVVIPTSGASQTVTVSIANDTLVEGDETAIFTLGTETGGTAAQQASVTPNAVPANLVHTLTITDNDTATLTYTAGPDVPEGGSNNGVVTLTITANGVSGTGTLAAGVTVAITNANGTAIGSDYGVTTTSVTFAGGSVSGATQNVTYTGTNDAFAEGTETFSLGFGAVTTTLIGSPVTATGSQTVNVTDTDTVTLTNGAGVINLSEATATTSGSYTLSINAQPGTSYTTLVTPDADTLISTDNITFSALPINVTLNGSATTTIYVRPVDDRSVEGLHTGTITHGALVFVSGSSIFTGETFSNTVVNITDNDTATVSFTSASSTTAEGNNSVGLTATLSIAASGTTGTPELGAPVTVALTATDGSAVSADYTLNTPSITFPILAGNGATQAFNYSALNDAYAEPSPESFTIGFGAITTSISTGISVIGTHTGNITDTDTPTITVTDASGSTDISEAVSTPDSYTIQLNAQPSDNYLTTITAAADCEVSLLVGGPYSGSVVATLSGSTATTVYVRAVNDNIIEGNHTCLIDNGTLVGGSPFNGLSITDITANVADNDSATISFSALTNTIAEPSSGSVNAVLTYVTNGTGPASLDTTLTANVTSSNGTASAGDYGSVTGSVTFNAGAIDGAVSAISYSAVNDAFAEDDETFNVNFGAVTGPVTASVLTHIVTITDAGDSVSITVTPNDDDVAPAGNELQVSENTPLVSDTYVITLNIEPGRTASTTITADANCLVSTDNVTFAASVPATLGASTVIYVRAVDDSFAETTPHPCVITHSALVSTVGRFNGQTVPSITADVIDNDVPAVVAAPDDDDIAPAGNEIYVSEVNLSQTDTYTITMNAVPGLTATTVVTSDVNCLVSTAIGGPFTASVTATLVGSTPTVIYVRAANDEYDEANPHPCGINHGNTVSVTAPFNNVPVNSVTGLVEDNDTFGVSVTQSGGTTGVSEAGLTDSYTFNLNSVPYTSAVASPVNVPVTSFVNVTFTTTAQCEISYDGITFAQSLLRGFNTTGTVTMTVRAIDDLVIEGPHSCPITHTLVSSDAAYNALPVPTIPVSIIDNDFAGVTVSPTTVTVSESGTTSSYTVSLNAQPTSNVTINVGGTGVQANASSTSLVFTPSNYNTPQTVTVTAIDDNVVEGAHSTTFTHSISTADAAYSALPAPSSVVVNIVDNDSAAVVVVQSNGNTVVQEGSQTDSYTVVLTSAPTSPVTISFGGLSGQVTLSAASLVFDNTNWNVPQTVTVTAFNDPIDEVEEQVITLTHTATSSDPVYSAISVASVPVTVVDNDIAAVIINKNAVVVTEGGAPDTYTVVLATEPTANVVVTVNGTAQATGSVGNVTFTPLNWNVPQTVTVTAVNDTVAEGAHVTVFTHSAASTDLKYSGITVNPVQVNITDNDTAGISIVQTGGNAAVNETGPTTDTYTIGLNSTPTGAANFTLTADAQCTISTDGITFASTRTFSLNSLTAQTITVRAVDDLVVESSPHACVITQTVTSTDLNYNNVPVSSVTVQVTDNDITLPTVDAVNDSASTSVNSAVTIPVLTNDVYTGAVTITIVTPPTSGTITPLVPSSTTIIYTNTSGTAVTDTFTYRITDANGTSDVATVTVNVAGANSQVNNGGFESGSPIPTGFTFYNRGSSGVVCRAGIGYTGNCALILYGSRTPVVAKQTLAVAPVAGNTVSIATYAKWANIRAGGSVQVVVYFTDSTSQTISLNVPTTPLNQATYTYLTSSGVVNPAKTVSYAELWISYTSTAGNIYFDDVTVNYSLAPSAPAPQIREGANPTGLLGLPDAPVEPDGFRGNN